MVSQQRAAIRIAVEPWELGGELLDILSRGLYTDAKDALREYVQNSVDAHAQTVHITIDGPVATIRDDGDGMDFETLRRARRLGASDKGILSNVGFRGIGIYAAFGICETLTIHTHQAEDNDLWSMRLHFGAMSRALERDRDTQRRSGIALTDLLFENTEFVRDDYSGDPSQQFTMVQLEGIQPEYRAQLSKLTEVHRYLLTTLPVRFPDVDYGPMVNHWMRDDLNLNPVSVVLRVGNEPEVVVTPLLANGVHEPYAEYVKDAEGRDLAFMWYAMSSTRDQVVARQDPTDSNVRGFLLKIKGFTIGDRSTIRDLWPLIGARALYNHYTGEIHLLDDAEVIPNAARNNVEAGRPREVLFRHLRDKFALLNSEADVARQILKAKDDLASRGNEAQMLMERASSPDESQFELYRLSSNLLEELKENETALNRLKSRGQSGRAKKTFPASAEQLEEIAELLRNIREPKAIVGRIAQSTNKRTHSKSTSAPVTEKVPPSPQVALLRNAVDQFSAMVDSLPPSTYSSSRESLESSLRLQVVSSAIAVLDGLKAAGFALTEPVESSRRQLRAHLGWLPNAPVTLEEALGREGFLPSTARELALVQAVDKGLLGTLGARGDSYQSILRAITEAVTTHPDLI